MKAVIAIAVFVSFMIVCGCGQPTRSDKNKTAFPIQKTDAEWKEILHPIAYDVMVKGGTEPPFNNPYDKNYQKGIYVSAATGEPLFSSDDKFDSGTGWPSFTKPISPAAIKIIEETSFGITGDEVLEAKTGLHLGHVFNDGPKERGGKRYCMNSAALKFIRK